METLSRLPLDVAALRARCAGPVYAPGDDAYDRARLPWNVAVDQRPAAVALPADARDVAAVLRAADAAGLGVAVQGTGHGAATLGDLAGCVLLRTDGLTGVEIDAPARRARVCAGALWQDVVPQAGAAGLAPVAGSSPDVGVVGYTLGGGIGYLSRRHGLGASHVTAIELVTAAGEHVRADAEQEPDLFWALRGAGFGLGVVTAMELRLHPVEALYAGALLWPWERTPDVAARWRELTAQAPRELTSMLRVLQFPPFPDVPEPLRGRAFVNVQVALLGGEEQGTPLLRGLRDLGPEIDTVAPMAPAGLLRLHGDPEGPTPAITDHALLDALPDAALDALAEHAGPGSGSPLVNVELRHLGGALREAPGGAGALATLDAEYALHTVGVPDAPEVADAIGARNAALRGALAPWTAPRAFVNFAGGPLEAAAAFAPDAHDRLRRIRAAADPHGLFRTPL